MRVAAKRLGGKPEVTREAALAYGLSGLAANANYVIGDRTNIYAETQPSQYQRIIDTKIFNNELV